MPLFTSPLVIYYAWKKLGWVTKNKEVIRTQTINEPIRYLTSRWMSGFYLGFINWGGSPKWPSFQVGSKGMRPPSPARKHF